MFFFVLGSGSRWRWHLHQFLDVKKLVNDVDTTTLRKHIIGDFSSCPFLNEKFVVIKFVCVCVCCFLVNIVTAAAKDVTGRTRILLCSATARSIVVFT